MTPSAAWLRPDGLRRVDAATALSVALTAVFVIPGSLAFAPLGALGMPALFFGGVLFLWWLWDALNGSAPRPGGTSHAKVGLLIFLASVLVVYAHSQTLVLPPDDRTAGDSGLLRMVAFVGLALAAEALASRERLVVFVRRVVIGATALATLGIVQSLTNSRLVDAIPFPFLSASFVGEVAVRGGRIRPQGTAVNAIEFGAVLAMLLPFALALALESPRRRTRGLGWVATVLIGFACLLSLSRTALVAIAIAVVCMLPTFDLRRRLMVLGAGVAGLLVAALTSPGLIGTLGSMFLDAADDPSVQSRTASYGIAFDFIGRQPLLGRGLGTFLPKYWILDNAVLLFAIGGGLLGVAALVLLVGCGMGAARAALRGQTGLSRGIASAAFASVASGGVSLFFFDAFSFPQALFTFALCLGLAGAAQRLRRAEASVDLPSPPVLA